MPKTNPAPQAPAGLERKSAAASPEGGLIEANDATGVVEAIVSVTGLLDEDRDVIKPGAYAKTLTKRKPKGIFAHDWAKWVARTEEIEELMPGDSRLPQQTKDGKPWPKEAGGLYVKCRFNLETQAGRDAFSDVKFYSETGEQEWSVGYKVPAGKSTRTKSGERHIEEMDLYEYSPVLFGANTMSGTLSVKSAGAQEGDDEPEDDAEETAETDDGELTAEELETLEAAADEVPDDDLEDAPDDADDTGAEEGEGEPPADASRPDDSPSEGKALFDLTPPPMSDRLELFRQWRTMQVPDISDRTMRDRVQASLFRLDQALSRGEVSEAEAELDIVLSQLRTIGQDPTIRSFTDGAMSLLQAGKRDEPHGPGAYDHIKGAAADEAKGSRASLDESPKKNWVENSGELPGYIREIARSIHEKRGMPLDKAIPIAIAQVKKWAAGGGGVDAQTKAKAAKALAEWEALKAKNRARMGKATNADELESTSFPFLPGTYEELREQIRERATKALNTSSASVAHVEVMGTWADQVVVTAYHADGKALSYEFPYALGDDGDVALAEPAPVELKVSVDGQEEDGDNLLPYPSVLDDVALDLKTLFSHAENKAGRVLSTVNEKRLLAAVENLVAVLKAAGLEVDASPRAKQEEEERDRQHDAAQYQDSTAPSARSVAGEKVFMDPGLLARGYRVLGDVHSVKA